MGPPRRCAHPNVRWQEKAPLARALRPVRYSHGTTALRIPDPFKPALDLGLPKPVCRRVLLVDDESEVLAVLEALLDDDWDVTTAQSGSDALEVLNGEETIDPIITDQRMPEMTGVELLQRVSDSHPDLYRMVLTAYSDVDLIVAAINQGKVDQFILKPWILSAMAPRRRRIGGWSARDDACRGRCARPTA